MSNGGKLYLAVLAAAGAILTYQLFIPPVVGIADQGDFVRTIGRFGYGPQHHGSLEYVYVEPKFIPDPHYRAPYWEQANSEYLFVGTALALNKLVSKDGALDITVAGLVHALAFLAALARLLWVVRRERAHAFLWIGALVALTDAGYAVYLNSFYAEPASCIFFLLLLAEAVEIGRAGETSLAGMLRWSLWSVLWVLAKPQNAPIGLILGLFTIRLAMWTRSKRARLAAVVGACAMFACAAFNVAAMPGVGRQANTYGMVFSGILGDSKNPEADLRALGLDPQLAKYAGTGAWSAGTYFPQIAASGVLQRVNTFTVLRFYLSRPARMWRRLHGLLPKITFLRWHGYGNFEPSAGLPPGAQSRAFILWSGFHERVLPWVNKWIVFALAGWPLLAAWRWVRGRDIARRRRLELLTLLPVCCLAALFSAVYGDAFDVIKHMYLFNLLLDTCMLYAAAAGWRWVADWRARAHWSGPRPSAILSLLAAMAMPAAVVAFYVWTADSAGHPFRWTRSESGYYGLLTEGFLAHHLYAAVAPVPELLALADPFDPSANARYRVHDMSLYRGKYYLYFGPAPVLALFLPWRVVTGKGLPEDCAALIFVTAGYVASLLLLSLLLRANGIRPGGLLAAAAAAALGLGQYGAIVLRDPGVYGVAIAAGYCFFAAAMYCFARLMLADSPHRRLAAAAGVLIGLAPGCRPQYALAAVVLCVVYIWHLGGARYEAVWFGAPIAICGLLLLWYNYARFGNPLEFGTSYQLTGSVSTRGVSLHLRNLADGLYYLLVQPPRLWDQFPFVVHRFVAPDSRLFVQNAAGLIAISPLAAAGLALPLWIGRLQATRPSGLILAALYGGAAAMLIFISLTGFAVGRYLLDFSPALLAISMFGWLWWATQSRGWLRHGVAVAIVAGSLWSTAMGAALSVGCNDILRDRNPRLFRTLARWSGQSAGSIRLPVDGLTMTAGVRFPAQPGAVREGLLLTGRSGAEDCLVVEYTGGNRLRFGYEKAAVGVQLGPEVTIVPGREYLLDVWYGGTAQRLTVSLDGLAAWNSPAAFYATSLEEIAFGRAAAGMPDVRPFSGVLSAARHGILYAGGQGAAFR